MNFNLQHVHGIRREETRHLQRQCFDASRSFTCINQSVGIQLLKENNPFFSIRISPSFRLSLDQSLHNTLNARVDGISSARFRHNKLHINLPLRRQIHQACHHCHHLPQISPYHRDYYCCPHQ